MNPIRKAIIGGGLVAATFAGGALGASLMGAAGAQSNPTTTTAAAGSSTTEAPTTNQDRTPDWSHGGHHANGKTETALTGDALTKVTAAAKAAVPGATVERVETDAEGATYEAHMTKSDGSVVTVKLDSSYKVTDTIDGMG
jgi:hypothetical protein